MKLRVDPVTVVLALLLAGGSLGDFFHKKQENKRFDKLVDTNVTQAKEIVAVSGNVQQQSVKIQDLVIKQAEAEKKFQATLAEKDKKVGDEFSILATQAITIAQTTPARDTVQHAQTSEAFMKQAGGALIDTGLAWNGAYVKQNMDQLDMLKKLLEQEKIEKDKIAAKLEQEAQKNEQITKDLVAKTAEHEKIAGQVQVANTVLRDKDSWIETLKRGLFWAVILTIIGGLGFLAYHIYQMLGLRKVMRAEVDRRREANQARYQAEAVANELKTATKTFLAVGPEGNDQMVNILKANGLHDHFKESIAAVEGKGSVVETKPTV